MTPRSSAPSASQPLAPSGISGRNCSYSQNARMANSFGTKLFASSFTADRTAPTSSPNLRGLPLVGLRFVRRLREATGASVPRGSPSKRCDEHVVESIVVCDLRRRRELLDRGVGARFVDVAGLD